MNLINSILQNIVLRYAYLPIQYYEGAPKIVFGYLILYK